MDTSPGKTLFKADRSGEENPPPVVLDWESVVLGVLADIQRGTSTGMISAKFHNTLADAICAVASHVGEEKVALTGGCFQNRYLTEQTVYRLENAGFRVYWHQRVPPNDGGISLGQIIAASYTD